MQLERALTRPRITGGTARGRPLAEEVGPDVRPTAARVREALFSLVGHDLSGSRVLDAFGGTGLLGLEAWSRGAEVVIVERDRRTVEAIRANVAALAAKAEVVAGDVLALALPEASFDGVLVDPPYRLDPAPIVAALAALTRDWLVLEVETERPSPRIAALTEERRRSYAGTSLVLYRRAPPTR